MRRHIALGEKFARWVETEGKEKFRLVTRPRFALTVLRIKGRREREGKGGVEMHEKGKTETKVSEGIAGDEAQLISPPSIPTTALGQDLEDGREMMKKEILEESNRVTKVVYERINAKGEIFLTSSMIKDVYAIRVVGANERVEERHLRRAFEILMEVTDEVLSEERKMESKIGGR